MRLPIIAVALLLLTACGKDTPTAPTPTTAAVAGVWSGTFESTFGGGFNQQAISLNLTQAGTGVNGTWAVQSVNWSGNISGTVDTANFSGAFTFTAPSASGGSCTGNASFSGPAGGATMTWNSPGVTGNCSGMPTGIRLILQRR